MAEHRQEFHRELEAIEANVIELFGMVAEDLPKATDALLSGNTETVRALTERDRAIDDLYPKIEELVVRSNGKIRADVAHRHAVPGKR